MYETPGDDAFVFHLWFSSETNCLMIDCIRFGIKKWRGYLFSKIFIYMIWCVVVHSVQIWEIEYSRGYAITIDYNHSQSSSFTFRYYVTFSFFCGCGWWELLAVKKENIVSGCLFQFENQNARLGAR